MHLLLHRSPNSCFLSRSVPFPSAHSWMLPAPSGSRERAPMLPNWPRPSDGSLSPAQQLLYAASSPQPLTQNTPVFSFSPPTPLLAQRECFSTLLPQLHDSDRCLIFGVAFHQLWLLPCQKLLLPASFGFPRRNSQFLWETIHKSKIYFFIFKLCLYMVPLPVCANLPISPLVRKNNSFTLCIWATILPFFF